MTFEHRTKQTGISAIYNYLGNDAKYWAIGKDKYKDRKTLNESLHDRYNYIFDGSHFYFLQKIDDAESQLTKCFTDISESFKADKNRLENDTK